MSEAETAAEKAGFVYILINPSFSNMIKIGLTKDLAEVRASKLSQHTGIPTEFIVVYDELVTDCKSVEAQLHERFASQRIRDRREFFWITPKEAIIALQELALTSPASRSENSVRVDILAQFEARCRRWLRRDLVGLSIVQFSDIVYLEEAYQSSLGGSSIAIERTDLDFIDDGGAPYDYIPYFSPSFAPEANALKFLNLDTNSLMHCFGLFTPEAYEWANSFEPRQELPFSPTRI
ncbi:GIY-YIG nuclease family protein [Nocardia sp. NPDC049707]|uniref:GIY-YIG nuclease family protein n=1 Tax=Nocardia sp. NPDC049707 TaxID=3154735 RepID=UPI0034396B8B